MFEGCESLTCIKISNFEVSKIKNFDSVFSGCSKLLFLNISNFYTKNAISMRYFFNDCNSMEFIDISNFDTSLVTNFKNMFSGCNSLESLNISHFKTSLVTSMEYIFSGCSSLKEISLDNFDTKFVTNMGHMFYGCSNLTSINLEFLDTSSVTNMEYMFYGCSTLKTININDLNTTLVENMEGMLQKCSSLTILDLSSLDTNLTKNANNMFSDDINLVYINFGNFENTNMQMDNMFKETLANIVFCFNKTTSPKLNYLMKRKRCAAVDCSNNWKKSRKKIVAKTNECFAECPENYKFLYEDKCYFRCPVGTFPDKYECKTSFNLSENENCTIQRYFMNMCKLNLKTSKEKTVFIENIVNEMISNNLFELVLMAIEYNYNFIVKEETEIYQIYALKNKFRDPNLTHVNFGECGNILREYNRLPEDDDIIVFKVEYTHPDFKIPIIEYSLFGIYGTKRLTLYSCSDVKALYYIPRVISNYEDYLYNPDNNYYYDKCYPSESINKTDLTIKDRMLLFNKNNMSLCESSCTFKGYISNNIICECKIKVKFNSFLNINNTIENLIFRFEQDDSSIANIWVFKCYFNLFTKRVITGNLLSQISLGIIFFTIISSLIFCMYEHNMLKNKILILINLVSKEEEENEKNNNDINSSQNKIIKQEKKGLSLLKNKKITENDINENQNNNLRLKKINLKKSFNNDLIRTQSKNNIINNKNKTIKDEKKMKEYEERTDNELNFMTYFDALIKDRRTFLQIYFSLIKTKNIIIFAFGCKNDFNPRTMKICFVFYIFSIFLVSNTLFITDTTLHDLFMSNGKSEIISDIQKIVYIIIISGTIKNILLIILFPESDILNIRKKSSQLTFQSGLRIQKSISMAIMRCYYYFFISIITLFIFWVYIACFFMIFQNTQLYALINTLISFGISLVIPFILYFIPACLRKSSLESKGSQNSYFLYSISKILQVIF